MSSINTQIDRGYTTSKEETTTKKSTRKAIKSNVVIVQPEVHGTILGRLPLNVIVTKTVTVKKSTSKKSKKSS